MALEFVTHDQGLLDQVSGAEDFLAGTVTAVLITTTHTPDRATDLTYADISANECADGDYAAQTVGTKAVTLASTRVRFDCGKITFCNPGSISGRYVYLLFQAAGALAPTDRIFGHVDLTGGGNASSTNSEFSYDPAATGLFELLRSAAA